MRIVITGLGAVSVAGVGAPALAEALGGPPPPSLAQSAGQLDLAGHLKAAKTYLDRNSQLGLLAASMALAEAGLSPAEEGLNVGVSFGTAFGNLATTETFLAMIREKGPKLASPLLFIHSYPNTTSSLMAIEWTLTGPALNFCTGSSAGTDAMIAAADAVRDAKADVMLTGSAEADAKLLQVSCPGLNFREAAGMFTLESQETASAREALVQAELAAWASGNDAGECAAAALDEAGVKPEDVEVVLLDQAEPPVGTAQEKCVHLNRYVGDTLSAGSVLGVIAAAMRLAGDGETQSALVLSGGINHAALVLKRYENS